MRSSQNLFEENIKNRNAEEKENPVDKKGLKLTWEAAQQHFFKGNKNIFLRHKAALRKINILAYIQNTRDLNVIREAMNSFTLEGFKKRYYMEEKTYPSLNLKVKGMR